MRGNKIWSIALLLSLALPMFAVVISPAYAQGSQVIVPTILNPLMVPGTSFTIDVLVSNVVNLKSFDFILNYDPTIITARLILLNMMDPIAGYGFRTLNYEDIDNTLGTVHAAPDRGTSGNIVGEFVGTGDGVNKIFFLDNPRILSAATTTVFVNGVSKAFALTTSSGRVAMTAAPAAGAVVTANYVHPGLTIDAQFPTCSIVFDVVSRGYSDLDLQGTTALDIYAGEITIEEVDGSFDNRIQGHLAAPVYKDTALLPGSEFDLVFTAENVLWPTWGVSFFLDYDTNVLEGPDYVQVTDLNLVTEEPVPIATVHFKLKAAGWTALHIRDIAAVSIYGDTLYFDSSDGLFTTVGADLSGRSAWPDTHQATYGDIDMLHARVSTDVPVTFEVVFSIYDSEGGFLVDTIKTAPMTIPELTTVEVTAPFDTTLYGIPRYKVWIGAQVAYDLNGDGIMDFLGIRVKPIPIMVKA